MTDDRTKRERIFDLVLAAFVQGMDGDVIPLAEDGEIACLSAQEVILKLQSCVPLGAKLRLSVRVPRTFFLEKPLEMTLSGTVTSVQTGPARRAETPVVRVRLDPRFDIRPLDH